MENVGVGVEVDDTLGVFPDGCPVQDIIAKANINKTKIEIKNPLRMTIFHIPLIHHSINKHSNTYLT